MDGSERAGDTDPGTGTAAPAAWTPTRGRPPRLTAGDIADAALEVGFADLTMATVAQRLRTSHSALYRHVRDRDALVVLAADRLLQRTPWPPLTDDWRADLTARGGLIWELLESHPGLDRELLSLTSIPRTMLSRFTETVEHLQAHGMPPDLAFLATDVVFDLAVSQFVQARPMTEATRRQVHRTAGDEQAPGGVTDMIRTAVNDPSRLWFDRKLALVLDGVAARMAAAGRPAR
jgi:AcrR family transcriptional regulator